MFRDDEKGNFQFQVDLIAKSNATSGERDLSGLASAHVRDAQRETVIQKGLQCEPALERGFINWDHQPGPINLIGYPIRLELIKAEDHPDALELARQGIHGLCLWAKARLWKAGKHKGADDAWELAQAVEGTPRRLAWSIQGRVIERDGDSITKSEITHLALTHQPILQVSFADIAKSFGKSDGAGSVMNTTSAHPLLLENLDGRLTSTLYGKCAENHYDNRGRFWKGRRGALEHLTQCKGHDLHDSVGFLKAIIMSELGR